MSINIITSPHQFGIKDEKDRIFLPLMLSSIKLTNPDANIYSPNPNGFSMDYQGICDISYKPYDIPGIEELRKRYFHLSTNPEQFELACIERFFVLREVALQNKLDSFYTVESDCLIFDRLEDPVNFHKELYGPVNNKIFLSDMRCISTAYLTLEFLDSFCDSILKIYSSESGLNDIKLWNEEYRQNNIDGGVCDMVFLSAAKWGWWGFNNVEIVDYCGIYEKNDEKHAFDNFMSQDHFYGDMRKVIMGGSPFDDYRIKKTSFSGKKPSIVLDDGAMINMSSLHFQGDAKRFMGVAYANFFNYFNKAV